MNSLPLIVFVGTFLIILIGMGYFLRGALFSITSVAAQHAKIYAVAYVRGSALVALAMCAAFEKSFQPLTIDRAAHLAWWDWVILYLSPMVAGLSVLVAFLDKSKAAADEVSAKVDPIIPAKPPTP